MFALISMFPLEVHTGPSMRTVSFAGMSPGPGLNMGRRGRKGALNGASGGTCSWEWQDVGFRSRAATSWPNYCRHLIGLLPFGFPIYKMGQCQACLWAKHAKGIRQSMCCKVRAVPTCFPIIMFRFALYGCVSLEYRTDIRTGGWRRIPL